MTYEISEEVAHINGMPQKVIIFLHGYIDSAQSLDKKVSALIDGIDNVALHIPQAPLLCEITDKKRQWYSVHRFDPNDARKTVPSFEECLSYYEIMYPGLEEAAYYINNYIDNVLQEYGLEDKDLFLCGFSQGAMLALYISMTRENKLGGCVSFSGILAGYKHLFKTYKNVPDTLLIHGDADNLIRFQALEFTNTALQEIGVNTSTYVINDGLHKITDDGIKQASEFIKKAMVE